MQLKSTQNVGSNNVACDWPTMLRPFAWAFGFGEEANTGNSHVHFEAKPSLDQSGVNADQMMECSKYIFCRFCLFPFNSKHCTKISEIKN